MFVPSRFILLLTLIGLTACSDPTSNTPNAPEPPANPELTALVVGDADSPFLDVLSERTDMVQDDGSQKVANHDLVIFDGDTHSPAVLAEHPRLADAMKEGVWVLVADATEAHKQEGSEPSLGLSSQGDTDAYLFGSVPGDMPVFDIMEMPSTSIKEPADELFSDELKVQLKERQHRKFVERVVAKVGDGTTTQQSGGCSSPLNIQAGILYATWCYSRPIDWDMTWASSTGSTIDSGGELKDLAGFWVAEAGQTWNGNTVQPQAGQNIANYTLTLLLNNQADVTGNSQSLHVAINGQMTPTTTTWESGIEDYLTGAPYLISDWLLPFGIPEPVYAWPQSQLELGMAPFEDVGEVLEPAANFAPQTPNNSETFSYTSSTSFTLGASLNAGATPTGPTGGGGVSGSYTVSSSSTQSKTITDWTWLADATEPIGQSSSGYAWTFKSQNPPIGESELGSFWDRGWQDSPNQLIRNLMQYSAEAIWTTSEVSNEKLGFALSSIQTLPSLTVPTIFPGVAWATEVTQGGTDFVRLDLGTVIPVTLEPASLTFADSGGNAVTQDNPVSAGEDVTATVNLSGMSPFSYSITSLATSLNDNAVITESPVRITKGDKSKTFTIETNENGLDEGDNVAVDVFLGSFGSTAAQQLWIVND